MITLKVNLKFQKILYYSLVVLKVLSIVLTALLCVLIYFGYIKELSVGEWIFVVLILLFDHIFLFLQPEKRLKQKICSNKQKEL